MLSKPCPVRLGFCFPDTSYHESIRALISASPRSNIVWRSKRDTLAIEDAIALHGPSRYPGTHQGNYSAKGCALSAEGKSRYHGRQGYSTYEDRLHCKYNAPTLQRQSLPRELLANSFRSV